MLVGMHLCTAYGTGTRSIGCRRRSHRWTIFIALGGKCYRDLEKPLVAFGPEGPKHYEIRRALHFLGPGQILGENQYSSSMKAFLERSACETRGFQLCFLCKCCSWGEQCTIVSLSTSCFAWFNCNAVFVKLTPMQV